MALGKVDPFGLPPDDAIKWFREKGYALNFDWRDMWGEAHARAFTVAKATQLDVLADLRQALDDALSQGQTLREFTKQLKPTLQKKGWWGEAEQVDPLTGEVKTVRLGSPSRLRFIYETNLRQAHAAARWERFERTAERRPWLRYVAVLDGLERAEHRRWHDTVLRFDHPWWDQHMPPNGWGCRCKVIQLSDRDLERFGLEPSPRAPATKLVAYTNARTGRTVAVPEGIDPSFEYNPGKVARGWAPPDNAPVLTPVRSYQDYRRPKAREAQQAAPPRPELWPRENRPADRANTEALFRKEFGIPDGRDEGRMKDAQGEEVIVSLRFLDHLRGDRKPRGESPDPSRTQFTSLVRPTLQNPYEVWMVPHRMQDGRVVMRKRYIGLFAETQQLVVVNRGDDGYVAWTTYPSRNLDGQRKGYLLHPR